jgi:hypothetical protein
MSPQVMLITSALTSIELARAIVFVASGAYGAINPRRHRHGPPSSAA